jgi:hypothetical protein
MPLSAVTAHDLYFFREPWRLEVSLMWCSMLITVLVYSTFGLGGELDWGKSGGAERGKAVMSKDQLPNAEHRLTCVLYHYSCSRC